MAPRLPRELMRLVAEELWNDVNMTLEDLDMVGEPDEVLEARAAASKAAFLGLSCANRESSELCAALRWNTLSGYSRAASGSTADTEIVLMRPALSDCVRSLTIDVSTDCTSDHTDILIALCGALRRLESFRLEQSGDIERPDVFERLFVAFARVERPLLTDLELSGPFIGPQSELGVIGSRALGGVISRALRLTTLALNRLNVRGESFGIVQMARRPQLVNFWGVGITCASGVAQEIGWCLGSHTSYLSIIKTAWPTQRAMLSAASTGSSASSRLVWHIDDVHAADQTSQAFERELGTVLAALPGLEAIRTLGATATRSSQWTLHASLATSRKFIGPAHTLEVLASRLSDAAYGRCLQQISIATEDRHAELEAVCAARRIVIRYYECVGRGDAETDEPAMTSKLRRVSSSSPWPGTVKCRSGDRTASQDGDGRGGQATRRFIGRRPVDGGRLRESRRARPICTLVALSTCCPRGRLASAVAALARALSSRIKVHRASAAARLSARAPVSASRPSL